MDNTGKFVGLILDLATRLQALEISDPPVARGVSGSGVCELELRLARVERDLTEQKPSANPPSHRQGIAQEASAVEDVGPAFEIGGRLFNSIGDCCSWLALKALGSIDYLGHWVDPLCRVLLKRRPVTPMRSLFTRVCWQKLTSAVVQTRPAFCSLFLRSFRRWLEVLIAWLMPRSCSRK